MKLPLTKQAAKKAYWTTMTISIILFIAGFLMPPMGEIHPSVLYACGSLMLFTTIFIFIVSRINFDANVDLDDKQISFTATHQEDEQDHDRDPR